MPDLSAAAAHLRQEAETRQRMGGFWTEDAYFRDAVAGLLEAIEEPVEIPIDPAWDDLVLGEKIRKIHNAAGAVAAVVVPEEKP